MGNFSEQVRGDSPERRHRCRHRLVSRKSTARSNPASWGAARGGELLADTNLRAANVVSTWPKAGVYDGRTIAIVTHLPVRNHEQLRNDLIATLFYRQITAHPLA